MPDILIWKVKLILEKNLIYLVNVYNILLKSGKASKFANIIIKYSKLWSIYFLIFKDFNLNYTNKDNCTINLITQI